MNHYKLINEVNIILKTKIFIVVNKPSGLLTIADRYKNLPNLKDYLLSKYDNIFTVHRLDKDTSGIMLFARNEETHNILINNLLNEK
jgi:23S rRNA pseudouridine1911/1915/1917 synthase